MVMITHCNLKILEKYLEREFKYKKTLVNILIYKRKQKDFDNQSLIY